MIHVSELVELALSETVGGRPLIKIDRPIPFTLTPAGRELVDARALLPAERDAETLAQYAAIARARRSHTDPAHDNCWQHADELDELDLGKLLDQKGRATR